MLSIITTFNPRATNIQDIRTAIQSWIKQPEVTEIFIYGVEEIDFYRLSDKIKYISSSGIPKVKDLIAYLNSYAKNIFVAYINSDIHLVGDLGQVFERRPIVRCRCRQLWFYSQLCFGVQHLVFTQNKIGVVYKKVDSRCFRATINIL
jgi:hypothetical protein